MNIKQDYIKKLGYIGLGLSLLMFIVLCIIFMENKKVPDLVMTLFSLGLGVTVIAAFLQFGFKFNNKKY